MALQMVLDALQSIPPVATDNVFDVAVRWYQPKLCVGLKTRCRATPPREKWTRKELRFRHKCRRYSANGGLSDSPRRRSSILYGICAMDIVLVNTPLYDYDRQGASYSDPPPLGLAYVGTSLQNHGHNVHLIDAVAEGVSVKTLLSRLHKLSPDCIGLNVFSTNLYLAREIVQGAPIVERMLIGGPAAGALCETMLGWSSASPLTIVIGEAEHVAPAILDGRAVLVQRQQQGRSVVRVSAADEWFPSSIDLPLNRSLIPTDPIFESHWGIWECHIISSRGCGYDCAFCGAAKSVNPGQKVRFRSEDHIAAELDEIRCRWPQVSSVRVLDDLFLRNTSVIERVSRLFADRGLRWRAMAHIAGLAPGSRNGFESLSASGCMELFVGIESGSPERRAIIGKPSDIQPTIRVIRALLDAGIGVKAYFIFGFPGETDAQMDASYRLATQLAEYSASTTGRFRVSAFKFRPYHGTRLFNELASSGYAWEGIHQDIELAAVKEERPYDFSAGNFSSVPTERLNEYIANTIGLNS